MDVYIPGVVSYEVKQYTFSKPRVTETGEGGGWGARGLGGL